MRTLASWTIERGGAPQAIELLQGDLTAIPPEHAVDIVVVSAFPNDYLPTRGSVIGALARRGISMAELAEHKQVDLRRDCSCWLSQPVSMASGPARILCIESGWRGTPPEVTDDLFRALAPSSIVSFPNAAVAMPIIGAGDQGWPAEQMLEAILASAIAWFHRGLAVRALKIVVYAEDAAAWAAARFRELQRKDASPPRRAALKTGCDLFLSYAHHDEALARVAYEKLRTSNPSLSVFYDRQTLKPGASWLMEIAETLDAAQRVVALYTPEYWQSPYCKDEFIAAFTRQHDTGGRILYPIFLRDTYIPYMFRSIQYDDCRQDDRAKLLSACQALCAQS